MNIKGFEINAQAIADGLYEIICARGEQALVAFGMLPYDVMRCAEENLRARIVEIGCDQLEIPVEQAKDWIDPKLVEEIVQAMMQSIAACIYSAAKRAGQMVV